MDTPRINISHPYGVIYPNVPGDYEWIWAHREKLLETYGECVLLVYEKKVVDKGDTLRGAMEDAERNLPPEVGEVTPVIEFLARRHPFFRPL